MTAAPHRRQTCTRAACVLITCTAIELQHSSPCHHPLDITSGHSNRRYISSKSTNLISNACRLESPHVPSHHNGFLSCKDQHLVIMARIKLNANNILLYLVALGMLGWLIAMAGTSRHFLSDTV